MEEVLKQLDELEIKGKRYKSVSELIEKYSGFEDRREEFMQEMVEKVVVYDEERVEVDWRYRDEFGEIE